MHAPAPPTLRRRLPVGAEVLPDNAGTHFRLWAPRRRQVRLLLEPSQQQIPLTPEPDGYFSALVPSADAPPGTRYRYLLDDDPAPYPDPASRYQPDGPHGPSQVIDPNAFPWTDSTWKGIPPHNQVLYELHIGTFTQEGTYAAAMAQLPALKELGVTCLEIMPLNEFSGRWGWGYDGVDLFAPFHHYGAPDDLRRLIDRCHSLGLAAILDLVYNHLGPDGNFLPAFSDTYFSKTHHTDWGDAINFDSDGSPGVREFFRANALHWITEYHFDGFRFDATQAIVDNSPDHILAAICRESRQAAARAGRSLYIINENEPQHTKLVRKQEQGGYDMDALWNDDFHHTAMVALTGRNEAYYSDYLGTPQELLSSAKHGYLYQGQRYHWQKKRRGTPTLDLPPTAFVHFLQNHDQIANSGTGRRVHQLTSPGEFRAMTALLLLMPQTPMLFQGQEFAASAPFFYFADHQAEIAKLVCTGRAKEVSQFPSVASPEMQPRLHNPCAESTFLQSKLDHAQRDLPNTLHRQTFDLHRDLLHLRRTDPTLSHTPRRGEIDGAVLGPGAFLLPFFGPTTPSPSPSDSFFILHPSSLPPSDRLLLVNLGRDLPLTPSPEPLLAPPPGHRWQVLLSTEHPSYGGSGTPHPDTEREGWHLPGRCALLLHPVPADQGAVESRTHQEGSTQSARLKGAPLSP